MAFALPVHILSDPGFFAPAASAQNDIQLRRSRSGPGTSL